MNQKLRIAVVGAGLIGRQHAQRVMAHPQMELAYVVDPFLQPADAAFGPGTIVTADLGKALSEVDGAIFATPNALHCEGALAAITAGVPALVEKPIADTLQAAEQMVSVAEAADVPLLIGHHRRHSPLLDAAAKAVASGAIGNPVAVMGSALFYKPDDYFDAAPWRRQAGGGPILINLIHDVDDLRAPLRGDRPGAGHLQQCHPPLRRGGHGRDHPHLRKRCPGHLYRFRHCRLRPILGTDQPGEPQLRHRTG